MIAKSRPPRETTRGKNAGWIALIALVLFALNLRSPLTSIAPVLAAIRADLGLGPASAGLLTTIPVLCFGLLAPAASFFIARTSVDGAVVATLCGVVAGTLLRSCDGLAAMLSGTVVIGAALTIGNIVALMVIARDFPRRMHAVTGLYTSGLNVGTMLTSGFTAPLALLLGWRTATAGWAVLAVMAIALWAVAMRRRQDPAKPSATGDGGRRVAAAAPVSAWRRPLVWLLAIAFASHLFVYFSLTAWLPSLLSDTTGMDATKAGFVASVFQVLALLGSFGVPLLVGRISGAGLIAGVALFWTVTALGFLAAPTLWLVWSITGGIASGGGFTAIFLLAMAHTADLDDNRRVSSVVQGLGYTLSAMGPMVVGATHQASGGWSTGLVLLAVLTIPMMAAGFCVSRIIRPSR